MTKYKYILFVEDSDHETWFEHEYYWMKYNKKITDGIEGRQFKRDLKKLDHDFWIKALDHMEKCSSPLDGILHIDYVSVRSYSRQAEIDFHTDLDDENEIYQILRSHLNYEEIVNTGFRDIRLELFPCAWYQTPDLAGYCVSDEEKLIRKED